MAGKPLFEPEQPCRYGHTGPRYSKSGVCLQCNRLTALNRRLGVRGQLVAVTLHVPATAEQSLRDFARHLLEIYGTQ